MTVHDSAYGDLSSPASVRFTRQLPGPVELVWSFLVESDKRAQWLAAGDMDLHPGGKADLTFYNENLTPDDEPMTEMARKSSGHVQKCRVIECIPPRRLVISWGNEGQVTFDLQSNADGVQLTVTHEQLPTRKARLSVSGGWHIHLDVLAAKLRGETPPRFWKRFDELQQHYDRAMPS